MSTGTTNKGATGRESQRTIRLVSTVKWILVTVVHHNRPEGRIFSYSDCSRAQTVSPLYVPSEYLSVQGPSVCPIFVPSSVDKMHSGYLLPDSGPGGIIIPLSGR